MDKRIAGYWGLCWECDQRVEAGERVYYDKERPVPLKKVAHIRCVENAQAILAAEAAEAKPKSRALTKKVGKNGHLSMWSKDRCVAKECHNCLQMKEAKEFGKAKDNVTGLSRWCSECTSMEPEERSEVRRVAYSLVPKTLDAANLAKITGKTVAQVKTLTLEELLVAVRG